MVTYLFTNTAHTSCTPAADSNEEMTEAGEASSTLTVSLASLETKVFAWITRAGVPNSAAWESGNESVVLVQDTGNHQITARVRIRRLNSGCTVQASGAFTGTQNMDSTRTFTPALPTGTELCGDLLVIEIEFTNLQTMNNSIGLAVGVAGECRDVSILTEGAGGCSGAGFAHSQGQVIG